MHLGHFYPVNRQEKHPQMAIISQMEIYLPRMYVIHFHNVLL